VNILNVSYEQKFSNLTIRITDSGESGSLADGLSETLT
jgi:hypothetical protein